MPLIRCVLENVQDQQAFYQQLRAQLPLPAFFGNNLDALWDVLTGDLPGPIEIIWKHPQLMGAAAEPMLELLRDAAEEREDLSLLILP